MERLRLAILGAACASFVAGLAVGTLFATRARPAENEGPFPDYERRFVEAFDPTPQQVSALRFLLQRWRDREEEIRNRFSARVEPELRALGAAVEESFREDILTPAQRSLYERLARGTPAGAQ